jgi:hypothetical protein
MYNEQRLTEMLMDEVSCGWQLILPREAMLQIPNAVLELPRLVSSNRTQSMSLGKSFLNGV